MSPSERSGPYSKPPPPAGGPLLIFFTMAFVFRSEGRHPAIFYRVLFVSPGLKAALLHESKAPAIARVKA